MKYWRNMVTHDAKASGVSHNEAESFVGDGICIQETNKIYQAKERWRCATLVGDSGEYYSADKFCHFVRCEEVISRSTWLENRFLHHEHKHKYIYSFHHNSPKYFFT